MGGRGANSSNVYKNIQKAFEKYIKEKGMPESFRVPDMQDVKQKNVAFETINKNYRLKNNEKETYNKIQLIKDDDGTQRLYYQGANEDVTDFSKSAINGVKKWMAHNYINRNK